MRHCRTFFAKRAAPLLLPVLEVWRGFLAISQSAYPNVMDCRDDKGRLICKQYFPEYQHILAQYVPAVPIVRLAPDHWKRPLIGDRSTQVVEETGQQC